MGKSKEAEMFILATFADGPYWISCLEPLLYPTGCSFYRPFSYMEPYVEPVLLEVLKDPNQLETFLSDGTRNRGIFGIRFRDQEEPRYRGVFIPLRLVKLTSVQIKDTLQVSFKLDKYVDLSAEDRFETIALDGIIDYEESENMLMVQIPPSKTQSFAYGAEPPNRLWTRLAYDESLSEKARRNFSGTTVLRLLQVTQRGQTAPLAPASLEPDRKDQSFGFVLDAGHVYDFDLAYNRISGFGEAEELIKYDFAFRSPKEHFAIARDRLPITGNYRRESIWVQPRVGLPAPVLLEWIGIVKTEEDKIADPTADKILPLRVPVLNVARKWPRQRIIYAVVVVGSLIGALVCSYFAYTMAVRPSATTGTQPAVQGSTPVIPLLTAMVAFFLATFASFLKDLIKNDS
jgi:hypothetical protein